MFKSQYTIKGMKCFKEDLALELSSLEEDLFKTYYVHLSLKEIPVRLKAKVAFDLELILEPKEAKAKADELVNDLIKRGVLEDLINLGKEILGIKFLHWFTEKEFTDFLFKTQSNLKETDSVPLTNQELFEAGSLEDLAYINLFRSEVGLGPISTSNIDYSDVKLWIEKLA